MTNFSKNLINNKQSIKHALEQLNEMQSRHLLILFVLDDTGRLVGTLTDGDVRRGLLSGKTIEHSVEDVMHRSFRFLQVNKFSLEDIDALKNDQINQVPLLDPDGRIIRIITLTEKRTVLPIDVVIMAGGEGKRLHPLTLNTPKPLLPVGDKPIIEHNIDRLESFGAHNFWISVNYLGSQIEEYFGGGDSKGIKISYIREKKFLGTIGSVSLVEDFEHDLVLIMNSDLLTDIDYEDFYRYFMDSKCDMAVAGIPYNVNVPYAIMEVKESEVLSFKEKPTYTYYSNGGIYFVKKKLLDTLPKGEFFNATDLMEKLINNSNKVVYYPILSYWLDVGRHEDYKKAQEDIKHLKF